MADLHTDSAPSWIGGGRTAALTDLVIVDIRFHRIRLEPGAREWPFQRGADLYHTSTFVLTGTGRQALWRHDFEPDGDVNLNWPRPPAVVGPPEWRRVSCLVAELVVTST